MEKQAAATDSLSPFLMVAAKSSFTVLLTLSSISGMRIRCCSWAYFIRQYSGKVVGIDKI